MSMFRKLVGNEAEDKGNYESYLDYISFHLRERILKESDLDALTSLAVEELRQFIKSKISEMIAEEKIIISQKDKNNLLDQIVNETIGYGPLEELLTDEEITEIMVNGPNEVFIEKKGLIGLSKVNFKSDQHIRHIIERIVAPIGRRVDESSPMVDGRLPDGSRVNAVIPPVSIGGPVISIRKFNKEPITMSNIIEFGTLNNVMAEFLKMAVKARLNIVISGGTGSGKTTFLNVLASAIPSSERIITIEDMAELRLNRSNVVRLEARPANMEGTGEITIRQLVKNALRMRPDRIVVGEVRGGEAMDMLQAMNTGHAGSITTIHANSSKDALSRLEAMVVMSNGGISVEMVRQYMIGALDLIVQIERLPDGSRKIVNISEVQKKPGSVNIEDVFLYRIDKVQSDGKVIGCFTGTGMKPECLNKFCSYGINIPENIFRRVD